MMTELNGIYLSDFNEIKKYIEKEVAAGTAREEALESLSAIYLEAQENGAELSEIRGESAKEYAKEIVESLPEKKKVNIKKFAAIAVSLMIMAVAAVVLLLNMNDDYLLEKRGLNQVFSNPYKYSVEISENVSGTYIYYNEKYEQKYESVFQSEIYKTEKGIISTGFIKNSGIVADEIIIREDGKTIFIEMHVEKTKDEFGKVRMISPVFPANKSSSALAEYGVITHFEASGVNIKINETTYSGAIRDTYVAKNGDIVFTVKTELSRSDGTDVEAYINEGKAVTLCFGSACTIKWERKADEKAFSAANLSIPKDFEPEYRYMTLEKTSSDGKVTISFAVYVDKNEKIADVDGWLSESWEENITKCDSYASDAEISEDGKSVFYPIKYEFETGELVEETLVFTLDDVKFSFDK